MDRIDQTIAISRIARQPDFLPDVNVEALSASREEAERAYYDTLIRARDEAIMRAEALAAENDRLNRCLRVLRAQANNDAALVANINRALNGERL